MVLDAAPREIRQRLEAPYEVDPWVKVEDVGGIAYATWTEPGDAEAGDHLAVLADKLQADGEDLGRWLALWLAGNDEETGEAVACLLGPAVDAVHPAIGGDPVFYAVRHAMFRFAALKDPRLIDRGPWYSDAYDVIIDKLVSEQMPIRCTFRNNNTTAMIYGFCVATVRDGKSTVAITDAWLHAMPEWHGDARDRVESWDFGMNFP